MQIVLVQPTDLSPSYLTEDFWEFVDEEDIIGGYLERMTKIGCEVDAFSSFLEAEAFVYSLDMVDSYKQKMYEKLDELKEEVKIFNLAVV